MANDAPFSTTPKAPGPPRRGRPPKNDSPRGRPPRGPRAPGDDEMPPEFAVATEEPEAPEPAAVEAGAGTGSTEAGGNPPGLAGPEEGGIRQLAGGGHARASTAGPARQ